MIPSPPPSLLTIIALARSGALDRARRLFREAGLESVTNDPATLSVRGRLLKDEARRSPPTERPRLWRDAGDAYARAAGFSGATYHLINAATLALLAGERDTATARAQDVLRKLDAGDSGPETPYYLMATRSEALLLLGRIAEAKTALAEAHRLAPEAWEDHASTLRQFTLILETLGQDAAWLAPLQPPRSLHFGGPIAVADDPDLRRRIDAVLADKRVGFAWGALAGGADLIIAEAALARGAELHLVLPAPPAVFRAESAAPLGDDWAARFDAVLAQASVVAVMEPQLTATTMLHIRLAAESAMGGAVMKAASLASEAIQLLLGEPTGSAGATAHIGAHWRRSGRRAIRLEASPSAEAAARLGALPDAPEHGLPAAMLAVSLDSADDATLHAVHEALIGLSGPLLPAAAIGRELHLALADPPAAAAAAARISQTLGPDGVRIAGHYGVARRVGSPFGGLVLTGSSTGVAPALLASVPPGAIHVSETFATALHSWPDVPVGETTYIGDLSVGGEPAPLYALAPGGC